MAHLSKEKIVSLARDLRNDVWTSAHTEWAEDDKYFNLEIPVEVPKWASNRKMVPSTARSKVVHAVSQMITAEPSVKRRVLGNTKADIERSELLGPWGSYLLRNLNRQSTESPFKEFVKHLLLYGYGVIYGPIWREDIWPMFPERNGRRRNNKAWQSDMSDWERQVRTIFPFSVEVPHPTKVLLDPSQESSPSFGILHTKRWAKSLKEEYPEAMANASIGDKDFGLVECWTYWSEDQYTMLCGTGGDVVLTDGENPYGFVPFMQAFSGFGQDTSFDTSESVVERRAVGLLRHIRYALRSEAQIATGLDEMIRRWAFQHLFVRTENAEEVANQMAEGVVVGLEEPQNLTWEQPPNVPNWVIAMLQERRQDAEAGTYGEVLRGQRVPGVTTAMQHAQMVSKAKALFNAPMNRLNHLGSMFLGNCAKLMTTYDAPVTIEGLWGGVQRDKKVSPKDFQANYAFEVNFEASDPMERAAEMQTGMSLRQAMGPHGMPGAISWDTFMNNYVRLPDVTAEREALSKEPAVALAMNSPEIQQAIMAEVQRLWNEKVGMIPQPVPQQPPPGMGPEMGMPPGMPPGAGMGPPPMGPPPMGPQGGPPQREAVQGRVI